ncbi:MAG: NTE family protein [Patiriisocius sp.]|jgi:NTE family protein
MKKIGLVLSGGGHRGVAHAGAIKAFEEFGIVPDVVSGTSAGAVVGAMYAANYTPEEILAMFKKIKLFSFSYFATRKAGFVNTIAFEKFLKKYFPDNDFNALSKDLHITAADICAGTGKVFTSGELIPAILSSSAVPGVFTPVDFNGALYSDGGIINNFPVEPIDEICDEIYGVYVCHLKAMEPKEFKHSYEVANRAINLMMHDYSLKQFDKCKVVVNPSELSEFGLFGSSQADLMFEIGYEAAKAKLRELG